MAQQVKNRPAMQEIQETWIGSLGREDSLEEGMATTPVFLPREPHGQSSRYSCLENPMDRAAWRATGP